MRDDRFIVGELYKNNGIHVYKVGQSHIHLHEVDKNGYIVCISLEKANELHNKVMLYLDTCISERDIVYYKFLYGEKTYMSYCIDVWERYNI